MSEVNLDNITLTPLKQIPTIGGKVMHALKCSDPGFLGFGEVYFSSVERDIVKAWKFHQRMTLNLVVPLGKIRFVFHLPGISGGFRIESIGENKYERITVPPRIWFGFQGEAPGNSLLMNLADIKHDPNEILHKKLNEINYNWGTL